MAMEILLKGRHDRKSGYSSQTKVGMVDMMDIFRNKKQIVNGLTKEEFIALFFKIPISVANRMPGEEKMGKWKTIVRIKRLLILKKQMAIIHKSMPKGTELSCPEFNRRILSTNKNIFFRCSEMETALGYRVLMDKIAKGVKEVGDGVVDVAEEEMEEGEEAVRTISESKAYAPLRK